MGYRPGMGRRPGHLLLACSIVFFACGSRSAPRPAESPSTEPSPFTGVVAVVPTTDHAAAVAWYGTWIGRGPDVEPDAGVAEWNLAGGGWIQVAHDPEHAGHGTVVVTVADVDARRRACAAAGLQPGEVQDFGVVRLVELADPDGNAVVFVQEVAAP